MKKTILYVLTALLLLYMQVEAQVPSIRMSSSAKIYKQSTAITAITPANDGGSISGTPRYSEVTTTTFMPGTTTAVSGIVNGTISTAKFNGPQGLAKDASGNIYVAERAGNRIRKIDFSTGNVSTIAGDNSATAGASGLVDATGTAARFNNPTDVTVDSHGNLFVADVLNYSIRKITPEGVVTTFAGTGASGSANGTGTSASFNLPFGITIDSNDNLYVTDRGNHRIRKITPEGVVSTFAGTTAGSTDGDATTVAQFNNPVGIDIDANGDFFISDAGGNKLRKITTSTMIVSSIAGAGTAGVVDGQGANATFNQPIGVAVDEYGIIYVSDFTGNKIRRVTQEGYVMTLAGNLTSLVNAVIGTGASFRSPADLLYDRAHRCLYVADNLNHTIRRINLTGYNVTPILPAGLSMNMGTGGISGTPTTIKAATDYTIGGFNTSGASTTTMSIEVVASSSTIYTITSTKGANGIISASRDVISGGSTTFTITPNAGYQVDVLTVNSSPVSSALSYTFNNVTSNQTINVTFKLKTDQTITFDALTKNIGETDFSPATSATSAINPITYISSNTDVATIIDGLIHLVGVGTTEITVSQTGNDNYNAAPDVTRTLTVNARPTMALTGNLTSADLTNPIADVTVSANGTLTIDDNRTVHNMTLEQGATIAITNNKLLEVNNLDLKAGYSGNLYDGFNTAGLKVDGSQGLKVNGRLRYVRTIDDSQWYFVAFPYDVTVSEITSTDGNLGELGTNWFIKYYDGVQRATGVTTGNWKTDIGTVLHANQGYIIALATGVKEFIFPLINNMTITAETSKELPVTYFGKNNIGVSETHKGWNLIGQPFLSKFNAGGTNLSHLVFSDGGSSKTYSIKLPNEVTNLNPFVSFFVQADATLETNNATFAESSRHLVRSVVQTELSDRVRIYFNSATGTDDTNLLMDNSQTTEYKIGQDLEKWIGIGTPKPQIYTIIGDVNYAYNALPINSILNLPIGFYTQTTGTCTIKANAAQASSLAKLLLTDTKDKITTDLLISDYSFTAVQGTDNSRFVITAQRITTGENIMETETDGTKLMIKNGKLLINSIQDNTSVRVYNSVGCLIIDQIERNNSLEIPLKVGVYTVQVIHGDNVFVQKVLIRK